MNQRNAGKENHLFFFYFHLQGDFKPRIEFLRSILIVQFMN